MNRNVPYFVICSIFIATLVCIPFVQSMPPEPRPCEEGKNLEPITVPKENKEMQMAKMKLMEAKRIYDRINKTYNYPRNLKEVERLKQIAGEFYSKAVKYYNSGEYSLSIVYSHLTVEVAHAIEEIGGR